VQTLVQFLPPTEGGFCFTMLRSKLSQLLAVAAVKVAENQTPDYIRAQLKERRKALVTEINGYRTALSNIIAPK
jgi:hypothetical protein